MKKCSSLWKSGDSLTHFRPVFCSRINQLVFTSKMFEKLLWKSDILRKDVGHQPASLLKMSLIRRCFC